ncbi:hypothetical protein GWK47_020426 [Chionoecetes opilio]|uniref:Uncharacterized protein n=1 Tax=Chionoecetes opilio TaxID=41210 RepID=A0A8J4XTT0_CHIOP|nr:hypothetical protein GWK47_020426 [Chionoecetes opilio]
MYYPQASVWTEMSKEIKFALSCDASSKPSQPPTQESAASRSSAHKPKAEDIPAPPLVATRSSQSLDRVSRRSALPMSPGADNRAIEGGLQSPDLPFQLISSV